MDIYSTIAVGSFAIAVVMFAIVIATCFAKDIKKCIKILKTAKSWYPEADKDKFAEMHKNGNMDYDTTNTDKQTGNKNLVPQNNTNPSRDVLLGTDQLTKRQDGTTVESDGTVVENDRILQGELSGTLFEDEEVKQDSSVKNGTVFEDESHPSPCKTIIEIVLLATENTMEVDLL